VLGEGSAAARPRSPQDDLTAVDGGASVRHHKSLDGCDALRDAKTQHKVATEIALNVLAYNYETRNHDSRLQKPASSDAGVKDIFPAPQRS
jgi:hypothetical protein